MNTNNNLQKLADEAFFNNALLMTNPIKAREFYKELIDKLENTNGFIKLKMNDIKFDEDANFLYDYNTPPNIVSSPSIDVMLDTGVYYDTNVGWNDEELMELAGEESLNSPNIGFKVILYNTVSLNAVIYQYLTFVNPFAGKRPFLYMREGNIEKDEDDNIVNVSWNSWISYMNITTLDGYKTYTKELLSNNTIKFEKYSKNEEIIDVVNIMYNGVILDNTQFTYDKDETVSILINKITPTPTAGDKFILTILQRNRS